MRSLLVRACLLLALPAIGHADCADLLRHEVRVLRSAETVDLCARYAGQPVLVVNTASHCGFTGQFEELEALYRRYAARGLRIAGFPSDSFRQEADDEAETAKVCFVNYGVTFDMYAPVSVRGADAHPLFKSLATAAGAPRWNFYKYLLDREGRVVARFSSMTAPDDAELERAIEAVL